MRCASHAMRRYPAIRARIARSQCRRLVKISPFRIGLAQATSVRGNWRQGLESGVGSRADRRKRHQVSHVVHDAVVRPWKPAERWLDCVCDGLEHRLHVRRRTGDHFQDIGGRGLPFQRLLVSLNSRAFSMAITAWSAKVCSKFNLLFVKWSNRYPTDYKYSNWVALAQQWHPEVVRKPPSLCVSRRR